MNSCMYMEAKTAWDLIRLISCALRGEAVSEKQAKQMDLAAVFRLAEFHSLTAVCAFALEPYFRNHPETDRQMADQWKQAKEKTVRKTMLMDAEREQILSFFEEKGIWYLPLKGCILKDCYPKYGMRQMSDNDILFDAAYRETAREYMLGRGYKKEGNGDTHHDEYLKPPIYNFELHTSLFDGTSDKRWMNYYAQVRERLLPDGKHKYGLRFQEEDFYIYVMAHAMKHHSGSGTGLRSVVDNYVYLQAKGSLLDWDYIRTETEKLGIREFEETVRSLSGKLFSEQAVDSPETLTENERELLEGCTSSGTYGTITKHVRKKLESIQADGKPVSRSTKLKYLWKRLFPDLEWYRYYAPFCYRHRWAIPFYCVYRMFKGLTRSRKKVWQEIRVLRK